MRKSGLSDEVVRAAQKGDQRAFAELYVTYRSRVLSICGKFTKGNSALAEEWTQDCFLRLVKVLPTFEWRSKFPTWLTSVCNRICLMHLRDINRGKGKILKNALSIEGVLAEAKGDRSGTGSGCQINILLQALSVEDSILAQATLRQVLTSGIEALAPGYRTVLTLHDIEGYEHHEIARMLGVSMGTTKSQLHKARSSMRAYLANPRTFEVMRKTHPGSPRIRTKA